MEPPSEPLVTIVQPDKLAALPAPPAYCAMLAIITSPATTPAGWLIVKLVPVVTEAVVAVPRWAIAA